MSVYSTKLVAVLQSFDVWTLNRLEKFIKSPYFNVNEQITQLFVLLTDLIKSNTEKELWPDKESVWELIHENEDYVDARLRKYFSDSLRLVEEFLIIEALNSKPLNKATLLLSSISSNRLKVMENQAIKTARTQSKRAIDRSSEYYYNQYTIEKELYDLEGYEIKRMEKLNVEKIISHLDKFYFAEKLRFYSTILSQKNIAEHEYNILFLEEILKHIEEHGYEDEPHIRLYFLIVKLASDPYNEEIFQQVKEGIMSNINIFPQDEGRDLYNAALNFCIRQLNRGNLKYQNELFDLYKSSIKDRIIFLNDEITHSTFRNVVLIGLRLNQFDWVDNFINNYSQYLNEAYRENVVNFNKARMHYYKKDYDEVVVLLSQVEFSDMSYSLQAKALLLGTYYELKEIGPLYSFIDSFRTFLNRNKTKMTEERRKNYINLTSFVKKLADVIPGDIDKIKQLEDELEKSDGIADVQWVKEKIEELKEGSSIYS